MLGPLLVILALGISPYAIGKNTFHIITALQFFTPGEPRCSNGEALVPNSIIMSSKKKNKLGPDKCEDGNIDTVCTTKSEPYPSITLDFGKPVDIAQVFY